MAGGTDGDDPIPRYRLKDENGPTSDEIVDQRDVKGRDRCPGVSQ
jgi:hypothetical protein